MYHSKYIKGSVGLDFMLKIKPKQVTTQYHPFLSKSSYNLEKIPVYPS